jgi:hypothetical protein
MDETTVAPDEKRWLRPELVASWPEVVIVMALTTGAFLYNAIRGYLHGSSTHFAQLILTDRALVNMIVKESAILGLMFLYLKRRGWTPADFRIRINLRGSLLGLGLPVAAMLANMITIATLFALAFLLGGYAGLMDLIAANKPELTPHSVHVAWFSTPTSRRSPAPPIFSAKSPHGGGRLPRYC